MAKLVEKIKVPGGDCPDAAELLPLLQSAVDRHGIENVRVYVNETTEDMIRVSSLVICCYKGE